jgi:thiamine-phosphate pyrophosphorylase
MKAIAKLHYITHSTSHLSTLEQVKIVTTAGVEWIQFRRKDLIDSAFRQEASLGMNLAKANKATFIINDRVFLAQELEADGVHLGNEDMNPVKARKILGDDKIIGCTANTFDDILRLSLLPIDYIGLGPYRHTPTKTKLSPILGLSGYLNILRKMADHNISIPIIAIGGILLNDLTALFNTGIHGVALSGAITNSASPQTLCNNILKEIERTYDTNIKDCR